MTAGAARVASVRLGRAHTHARPDWDHAPERTWTSAYGKDEVSGAAHIGPLGLEGDEQYDRAVHGGPDMAVLAYALEHYARWREEYGAGARGPGGFGENLTLEGLDEPRVAIGDVLRAGSVTLQVSQPRGPCANISRWWNQPGMLARVAQTGRTGWYHRVIAAGEVRVGDPVTILERPNPEWTLDRVLRARLDPSASREVVEALTAVPELSAYWRDKFAAKLAAIRGALSEG